MAAEHSTGAAALPWPRIRVRRPTHRDDTAERLLAVAGCGTRDHSHKVASLATAMANRLGLKAEERRRVKATARLHDVGKSIIPTSLVDKPGPLTPREWELMHLHTVAGERLVSEIGEPGSVARAVRHSHERWDGHGYPDGLCGPEIPLASRIVFCADAFDAICSDRPYRPARSEAEGLAEIRRCAGSQFDPRIVDALTEVIRPRLHGRPHAGRRRARGRSAGVLLAFAAGLAALSLGALGEPGPRVDAESALLSGESYEFASPAFAKLAPSPAEESADDAGADAPEPETGTPGGETASAVAEAPTSDSGGAEPSKGDGPSAPPSGDPVAALPEPVKPLVEPAATIKEVDVREIEAAPHQGGSPLR